MYTKLTLADCKQSLADRLTNGIVPTLASTTNLWVRLLNRGLWYVSDKIRISKSVTLTPVSGTVALPDDFILVNKVFYDTTEQTLVDQDDLDKHTGNVYWISGDQFNGFYFNAPEDKAYTVSYVYRPDKMVSDSDVCVVPDIEAIVAYAYSKKRKSESDPFGDAAEAMAECDARIKEMTSQNAINSDGINFTWE